MKKIISSIYTKKTALAGLLILGTPLLSFAQENPVSKNVASGSEEGLLIGLALFLAGGLIFATLGLLLSVIALKRVLAGRPLVAPAVGLEASGEEAEEGSFWEKLKYKLTDAVPVEQEEKVMTDHEYDGIRELDNSLPPWWKAMFYATIVFSVIYLAAFHLFGWGQLQEQEYETELAEAKLEIEAYMAAKGGALNEDNVEVLTDEALLAEGKSIFAANCAACHGAELQGTVGPNLADSYWIHGGSVGDIFKTIRDGVPSKGMISWKAQLSPEQIQQVSSYIISMEGSNPPNAKEPQGELFER